MGHGFTRDGWMAISRCQIALLPLAICGCFVDCDICSAALDDEIAIG
jgi:hypothetical protein